MTYEISLFRGADASATRIVTNIASFAPNLITESMWAPGIFEGGVRANKNLKSISLLVLDVDEGVALVDALKIFSPYKHVIGTSKSHQVEKNGVVCDRFRVILFLDQPATSDSEFKEYWFAAYAKWSFIDKACKDSARFFFPCKEVVSVNDSGITFSERFVLPYSAKDWSYKAAGDKLPEGWTRKGKLSKATKDFLIDGAPDGEWHGRFFKAAMDFKEQGYSIDEARMKLAAVTGVLDDVDEQQLEDVYANREPKYGPRGVGLVTDWPVMRQGQHGEYADKKHPDNLRHLFKRMGYNFAMNLMEDAIYTDGRPIDDADLNAIWGESRRQGLEHGKDFIAAEMSNVAGLAKYHPIKDAIEAAPWDGSDHIGNLYKTLTIAGDLNYDSYIRKWLVGVVAKLYRPGSQNLVLTFVGTQGIGKSRWFTKLALYEPAFGEGAVDPTNRDHELRHLTHLIWHIPELDYTTGKRETGALKDYLTRDFVAVRPAYARYVRKGRSICSFAASVNASDFLVDQSGNRRFLVIPLDGINAEHEVNVQQCYAQAKSLLDSGYQWWLSGAELAELNDRNSDFEVKDLLVTFADTLEAGTDPMTLIEVCALAGKTEPTLSEMTRMGMALARRGFKKQRAYLGGKRMNVYLLKNPKGSKELKVPKPL